MLVNLPQRTKDFNFRTGAMLLYNTEYSKKLTVF